VLCFTLWQEISGLHQKLRAAEEALAASQQQCSQLQSELEGFKRSNSASPEEDVGSSDGMVAGREGAGQGQGQRDLFRGESMDKSASKHRRRRLPPSLLETRILEARHMQWASAVHLRESSVMIKQCEKVNAVISLLESSHSRAPGDGPDVGHIQSRIIPLRKSASDLEQSFESSRKLAVSLDSRLESARHTMYADVLSAVEPEIDAIDTIFNMQDPSLVHAITSTVSAINKSIRYRPGESKLRQEHSADHLGGAQSAEYLFSLRGECKALVPVLSEFMETACLKCEGLVGATQPVIRPLEDVMDDCFLQHAGDYSYVCDMLSCTMVADSLDVVRELLGVVGANDGERKRVNLPGNCYRSYHSLQSYRWHVLCINRVARILVSVGSQVP
jgi:hypothetical protein